MQSSFVRKLLKRDPVGAKLMLLSDLTSKIRLMRKVACNGCDACIVFKIPDSSWPVENLRGVVKCSLLHEQRVCSSQERLQITATISDLDNKYFSGLISDTN